MSFTRSSRKSLFSIHTYEKAMFCLCVLHIFLRLPLRTMIPFNDGNVYYATVFNIIQNNLNPFIFTISYKPPVISELMAIIFSVFHPSIVIGNIAMYIISSVTLWYIYLLGKRVFTPVVGFYAALLCSLFPLFTAQSVVFNDAVIVTTVVLATVYYFFSSNWIGYGIACSLLVLTKEPLLAVPVLLYIYSVIYTFQKSHTSFLTILIKRIPLLFPLILFPIWMYINKQTLGIYLDPINQNKSYLHRFYGAPIQEILKYLFVKNGMWWIWLTFGVTLLKHSNRIKKQWIIIMWFITIFLFYGIFFSLSAFNPRYMLPYFPYVFISFCAVLFFAYSKKFFRLFILLTVIMFLGIHINLFFFNVSDGWGEGDLRIIQTTSLYTKTFEYVYEHYQHPLIVTYPEVYTWSDTAFGKTPGAYKYECYFFNQINDEKEEMQRMFTYAKEKNASPIIFIQPSYMGEVNEINAIRKLPIKRINNPWNKYNYHDLYEIAVQ